MRASATGPIGALLMVAPLIAIPVVAVVGIPQFASVAASPLLQHDASLEPEPLTSATPSPRVASSGQPAAPSGSADDLFSPVDPDQPPMRRGSRSSSRQSQLDADLGEPDDSQFDERPASRGKASDRDKLGDWEVVDPNPVAAPKRPAPRGVPSDSRELALNTDSKAARENRRSWMDEDRPLDTPARPAAGAVAAGSGASELDESEAEADSAGGPSESEFSPPQKAGASGRSNPSMSDGSDNRPATAHPVRPASGNGRAMRGGTDGSRSQRERRAAWDFANQGADAEAAEEEPLTYQSAARRLKELGVKNYHLELLRGEDRFLFTCAFAHPQNARIVRKFEAEALEPLAAVQQVLTQIEQWRKIR